MTNKDIMIGLQSQMTAMEEIYKERSYPRNIRHIGYSLLKDVDYSGEPVVPKILSEEKEGFAIGEHFNVEKVKGIDLSDFLVLPEVKIKDKFLVILHVTKQLEAIDKAGFVLLDRHGGNVIVLNWKDNKISTRQIDIEDFYDKLADAPHSLTDQKGYSQMIDLQKEKGVDLWAPAVDQLVSEAILVAEKGNKPEIVGLLSKLRWNPGNKKKGSSLEEYERVLLKILEMI